MEMDSFEYRSIKKAMLSLICENNQNMYTLYEKHAQEITKALTEAGNDCIWIGHRQRCLNETLVEVIMDLIATDEHNDIIDDFKDVCMKNLQDELHMSAKEIKEMINSEPVFGESIDQITASKLMPILIFLAYNFFDHERKPFDSDGETLRRMLYRIHINTPYDTMEWMDFLGDEWFGEPYGQFSKNAAVKKNVERFKTRLIDCLWDNLTDTFKVQKLPDDPEQKQQEKLDIIENALAVNRTLSNSYRTPLNDGDLYSQIVGNVQNRFSVFTNPQLEFVRNAVVDTRTLVMSFENDANTVIKIGQHLDEYCYMAVSELYRIYVKEAGKTESLKSTMKAVKKLAGDDDKESGPSGKLKRISNNKVSEFLSNPVTLNPRAINKMVREIDILPYAVSFVWHGFCTCLKVKISPQIRDTYVQDFKELFGKEIQKQKIDTKDLEIDRLKKLVKKGEREKEECNQKVRNLSLDLKESKEKEKTKSDREKELEKELLQMKRKYEKQQSELEKTTKLLNQSRESREILEEKMAYIKNMKTGSAESNIDFNGKYAFISAHPNMNAKLKEWFPNSVNTLDYEITDANAASIKAVVCITVETKHPQYYKTKAICVRKGIPFINCNSVNFNKICDAISQADEAISEGA